MLGQYNVIGFIPVRELARAEDFYAGRLGLEVIGNDGFALVLRAHGTMVRCVLTPDAVAAQFTILGWEVPAIATAAQELAAAGVAAKRYGFFEQDEAGIWTAPDGSKVLWFEDPDGNVLSLSQHAGVQG